MLLLLLFLLDSRACTEQGRETTIGSLPELTVPLCGNMGQYVEVCLLVTPGLEDATGICFSGRIAADGRNTKNSLSTEIHWLGVLPWDSARPWGFSCKLEGLGANLPIEWLAGHLHWCFVQFWCISKTQMLVKLISFNRLSKFWNPQRCYWLVYTFYQREKWGREIGDSCLLVNISYISA